MSACAESGSGTQTVVQEAQDQSHQVVTLRLSTPKADKKVQWKEGTVDNENAGKKSSKCCCIYKKPRAFGESSSEEDSDDEDKKCRGPNEYHKGTKKHKEQHHDECDCVH